MAVSQGVSKNFLKEPVQVEVTNGGTAPSTDPLAPNYVSAGNRFSDLNSTTTPLGSNQAFTGEWEDVSNFVAIEVLVNTDHIAATDSVWMQFSTNGTDLDLSRSVEIVVGGDFLTFPTKAKFFRLIIQNGAVAQTFLRVQTQFLGAASSLKSTPLIDLVTDGSAAVLTKTVIEGKSSQGGSTYVPVKVDPAGKLLVDTSGSVVSSQDVFVDQEDLPDQAGAGAVLTFTFTADVHLIYVYAVSGTGTLRARASIHTPSATAGIVCDDGVNTAIPVTTSVLKVFAPTGMTISVSGLRY